MTQGLLLPAIFISFLSPMTCKRRREGGRRKREEGEVSVFLHLEALAELYINTFVKWAGVVEYWCVSECVFFFFLSLRVLPSILPPRGRETTRSGPAWHVLLLLSLALFTYVSSPHSLFSLHLSSYVVLIMFLNLSVPDVTVNVQFFELLWQARMCLSLCKWECTLYSFVICSPIPP